MTSNSFAMQIGLTRCENLYQIKRGNFGITRDLADRITTHFPEISRTWLLTGAGHMLMSQSKDGNNIPYYDFEVEQLLDASIVNEKQKTALKNLLSNRINDVFQRKANTMNLAEQMLK